MVASAVAAQMAATVGGVSFSTRAASCRASGESDTVVEVRAAVGHDVPVDDRRPDEMLPSEAARFEEVCRLGHDQLAPVAATVAAAFAEDPIWRWMFSGDQRPMTDQQRLGFARYFVSGIVAPGEIHGFRHHGAVALWTAPTTSATKPDPAIAEQRSAAFAANVAPMIADLGSVRSLAETMAARRPAEPHWYLGILGAHPDRQGQGFGGRVLQPMHDRCDRVGLPIYLESSNPANDSFYSHLGYEEGSTFSAAGSPDLKSFLRQPRPALKRR